MRYRMIVAIAAFVMALDQITKWLVLRYMEYQQEIPLTNFFSIVSFRNSGAAFGFLSSPEMTWQFWIFFASCVISCGVVFYIAKGAEETDKLLFTGLGCIVGGAIGNLIDRIRLRAVVDFLDFHIGDLHWPAFNVADIAICTGAFVTAVLLFPRGKAHSENGDTHS